jgi:pilus assembly protein CpaC
MITLTRTAPLALAGALIGALGPALANGVSKGEASPTTVLAIQADQLSTSQRVDLSIGRSLIIELPRDAKEVFVANPKVANAVVRSTRKVFVIGMDNGATSIFVMDGEGRQIASLEVNVGRDLNVLAQTLRTALPQSQIQIRPAGSSVLLTGVVASAIDAQQAVDIANAFVGISADGGVAVKGAVINALTVRGKDQVMLQVTVAEVARTVLKQFGINTSGSWSAIGGDFQNINPFPVSPNANPGNFLSASLTRGGFSARASLQAFERAGVSRVLAEPTLTAISGESAKFTAGGEIPIPRSEDCDRGRCTIGFEYKPYGVTLSFTPVVMAENRISLRVSTEVTEVDPENQFRIGTLSVPGMKVRKAETTVELPSGAVMMTAGLIQQTSSQAINGLPGLLNLPVLGALFRSRDYQRKETELMIMVTPMIAKPMNPNQVARPDDGFVDAHDGQTVLLGRLNRLYGVAGAAPAKVRSKGQFGFITD